MPSGLPNVNRGRVKIQILYSKAENLRGAEATQREEREEQVPRFAAGKCPENRLHLIHREEKWLALPGLELAEVQIRFLHNRNPVVPLARCAENLLKVHHDVLNRPPRSPFHTRDEFLDGRTTRLRLQRLRRLVYLAGKHLNCGS